MTIADGEEAFVVTAWEMTVPSEIAEITERLEKLPEVDRYQAMFNHLVAKALGPDESVSLIAQAAADLA